MFAIGDKKWPDVSKILEEMSELGVEFAKLMGSRGEVNHWSHNLWDAIHDEMGDVLAAITFVMDKCGLDKERIMKRMREKYATFNRWHEEDPEDAERTR